eukprot:TRINITY_DN3141_c4_g1_i1.p1 TRINITY_DN3141_c4_g1~~TRINITY_DN3141_c4_g1_i1.p1  ORF type:complete len:400 (-),score=52.38 TRINITY_DN3141_c4_g1_i1:234-1310(-)
MKTPSPSPLTEDTHWLFKPHTLTILTGLFVILLYVTIYSDTPGGTHNGNIKTGLIAILCVFLLFCAIQLPDGFFIRPHPSFWRVVQGMSIVYLLILTFMLFQTPEFNREILLNALDPTLGVKLPEKHYAEDCRVFTPENPKSNFANIMDKIDIFVPAHFIGWVLKYITYRDVYFAWFMSLLFEACELSLQHILPNFAECWWDHLFFDIIICNGIGIYIGYLFMKYQEQDSFNWAGFRTTGQKKKGLFAKLMTPFTPYHWTQYRWAALSSPNRFLGVIFLMIAGSVAELNTFFLKYTLWIPSGHMLVLARLLLMLAVCIPGSREYYEYLSNPFLIVWFLIPDNVKKLVLWHGYRLRFWD